MPVFNKQLEEAPRKTAAVSSDPSVQTGEGIWYTKIVGGAVEGFFKDDQGNVIQMTSTGGIKALASVNGKTGTSITLTPDDLDDSSTTNKFISASELSKLSGIEAGAEVNDVSSVNGQTGAVSLNSDNIPEGATNRYESVQANATEITNATETATRSHSPADIKSYIDQHASASSKQVYRIRLPDAADLASRISAATFPSGWSLTTADADGESQFGTSTDTLVIIWDSALGTKIADISVFEDNTSTTSVGGIKVYSTSESDPSSVKTNSSQTKAAVFFGTITLPAGRDVYLHVALV